MAILKPGLHNKHHNRWCARKYRMRAINRYGGGVWSGHSYALHTHDTPAAPAMPKLSSTSLDGTCAFVPWQTTQNSKQRKHTHVYTERRTIITLKMPEQGIHNFFCATRLSLSTWHVNVLFAGTSVDLTWSTPDAWSRGTDSCASAASRAAAHVACSIATATSLLEDCDTDLSGKHSRCLPLCNARSMFSVASASVSPISKVVLADAEYRRAVHGRGDRVYVRYKQ